MCPLDAFYKNLFIESLSQYPSIIHIGSNLKVVQPISSKEWHASTALSVTPISEGDIPQAEKLKKIIQPIV